MVATIEAEIRLRPVSGGASLGGAGDVAQQKILQSTQIQANRAITGVIRKSLQFLAIKALGGGIGSGVGSIIGGATTKKGGVGALPIVSWPLTLAAIVMATTAFLGNREAMKRGGPIDLPGVSGGGRPVTDAGAGLLNFSDAVGEALFSVIKNKEALTDWERKIIGFVKKQTVATNMELDASQRALDDMAAESKARVGATNATNNFAIAMRSAAILGNAPARLGGVGTGGPGNIGGRSTLIPEVVAQGNRLRFYGPSGRLLADYPDATLRLDPNASVPSDFRQRSGSSSTSPPRRHAGSVNS